MTVNTLRLVHETLRAEPHNFGRVMLWPERGLFQVEYKRSRIFVNDPEARYIGDVRAEFEGIRAEAIRAAADDETASG